jgi:hypothetical protein
MMKTMRWIGGLFLLVCPLLYATDPEAARRQEIQYRSRIHEEVETGRMDRATGERLKAQEKARQLKETPPPRPDNPQLNR